MESVMEVENNQIYRYFEMNNVKYEYGDVWLADLGLAIGSEQKGVRPVLIIQNKLGNLYSPTVIVAIISSKMTKKPLPTHVRINADPNNGLQYESVIFAEQIKTIDKVRLINKICTLDNRTMNKVKNALTVSLAMN